MGHMEEQAPLKTFIEAHHEAIIQEFAAFAQTLMPAGTEITLPPGGPRPTAITYTNWEAGLGAALGSGRDSLSVEALGRLRVEVLRRLAGMPASDER